MQIKNVIHISIICLAIKICPLVASEENINAYANPTKCLRVAQEHLKDAVQKVETLENKIEQCRRHRLDNIRLLDYGLCGGIMGIPIIDLIRFDDTLISRSQLELTGAKNKLSAAETQVKRANCLILARNFDNRRLLSLAMAQHPHLGINSIAKLLTTDDLHIIFHSLLAIRSNQQHNYHHCSNCSHTGYGFSRCSRCKIKYYCSRDCQRRDWKWHALECQPPF